MADPSDSVPTSATISPAGIDSQSQPAPPDNFLSSAVSHGNLQELRKLLNASPHPDLSSAGPNARLVHDACTHNYLGIVKCLFSAGALPDHVDSNGDTPLLIAVRQGFFDIAEFLLSVGASLYARDSRHDISLHIALTNGYSDIVRLLVSKAPDKKDFLNTPDGVNRTALFIAVRNQGADMVEYLLDEGADGSIVEALEASRFNRRSRNLALLLDRNPELLNQQGGVTNGSCLHRAAFCDAGDNVELLLSRGADGSILDEENRTAWDVACDFKALTAMSAFAYKEMEGKNADPPHDFSIYEHAPHGWVYISDCFLKAFSFMRRPSHHQGDIEKFFRGVDSELQRDFIEPLEPSSFLCAREPGCAFGTVYPKFQTLSLSMPYFYSVTYSRLQHRWPTQKAHFDSLKYCRSANPIALTAMNLPLTIDEYCKPVLGSEILSKRNRDQVLQWFDRRQSGGQDDSSQTARDRATNESQKLLVVEQAWLLKINDFVVTCFRKEFQSHLEEAAAKSWNLTNDPETFNSVVGEQNEKVAIFLSSLVDFLDRPISAGLPEPIFNTFEKAIVTLSEDVNEYMRSADVENLNILKERQYYHNIWDVREELSMIKAVLTQQEEVWRDFVSHAFPRYWKDGRLYAPEGVDLDQAAVWQQIIRPQIQFPKFNRRIDQLDEQAQRVESSISVLLDLKARHADIKRTEASMKEAHSTSMMSAAIFGFSMVTIIFTPLSFMTSLFALPIRQIYQHQIAGMYTTNYIGKWLATCELVSVFLTLVAMWAAIEYGLRVPITNRIREWIQSTRSYQTVGSGSKPVPAGAETNASVPEAENIQRQHHRRKNDVPDIEKGQSTSEQPE